MFETMAQLQERIKTLESQLADSAQRIREEVSKARLEEHDWGYQMSGKMSPEAHASWHAHRAALRAEQGQTKGENSER